MTTWEADSLEVRDALEFPVVISNCSKETSVKRKQKKNEIHPSEMQNEPSHSTSQTMISETLVALR